MNRSMAQTIFFGCLTFSLLALLIIGVDLGISIGLAELVHAAFNQVSVLQAFVVVLATTWVLGAIGGTLSRK